MASVRVCLHCAAVVRPRQEVLQCSSCHLWQHRTCSSGITQAVYREALRLDTRLEWSCAVCGTAEVASHLSDLKLTSSTASTDRQTAPKSSSTKTTKLFSFTKKTIRVSSSSSTSVSTTVSRAVSTYSSASTTPSSSTSASSLAILTSSDGLTERHGFTKKLSKKFGNPLCQPVRSRTDDAIDALDLPPVCLLDPVSEDDVQPLTPCESPDVAEDPDYQIIDDSSQRGKPKLFDNKGFTYIMNKTHKTSQEWRCSVRNKTTRCCATVKQVDDKFTRGSHKHNHPSDPSAASTARIYKNSKDEGLQNIFEPALQIAERVSRAEYREFGLRPNTVNLQNVARAINYHRDQHRPENPTDLNFVYDNSFIPKFCIADISVTGRRHLLFASQRQIDELRKAKTWYVDGTFKVVREPFTQLWSIHAFVSNGLETKQLPFVYVVMSGKRIPDYVAVFNHLLEHFPAPS